MSIDYNRMYIPTYSVPGNLVSMTVSRWVGTNYLETRLNEVIVVQGSHGANYFVERFLVSSTSQPGVVYQVNAFMCSCPAAIYRKELMCKHIIAIAEDP